MINDLSRPLVLLGTNYNIEKFVELFEEIGYTIKGIIDDDYHGQGHFRDIPVIARESEIEDFSSCQFICITNWYPDRRDAIQIRNRKKRTDQIKLLDELDLSVATAISTRSVVSNYAKIGKGVIVDAFAVIEPHCTVGDYSLIYNHSTIGHNTSLGKDCVMQRYAGITSQVEVKDEVYFGLCSRVSRSKVTISSGTFIHPNLTLLRSTTDNEEIGLAGKDLRKVYQQIEVK